MRVSRKPGGAIRTHPFTVVKASVLNQLKAELSDEVGDGFIVVANKERNVSDALPHGEIGLRSWLGDRQPQCCVRQDQARRRRSSSRDSGGEDREHHCIDHQLLGQRHGTR